MANYPLVRGNLYSFENLALKGQSVAVIQSYHEGRQKLENLTRHELLDYLPESVADDVANDSDRAIYRKVIEHHCAVFFGEVDPETNE